MKKILIISPHYPPSNLAAVHRSRLFAQHLPAFGWKPVILTVDERFYEEQPDWNLSKLIPTYQQIEKVAALPVTSPRLIGDIGLRAFFHLCRRAMQLIREECIDFLYIPIPSFYAALIGRYLNEKTGVPYGIDYIDPWVHQFPGSDKLYSRHWWSTKFSRLLEPIAVKKASLITGVAEGYYRGVIERNPHLLRNCRFGAMPYGGDEADHQKVKSLGLQPYLFARKDEKIQLVYAGAMLPKAYEPLEAVFKAMAEHRKRFVNVEFHFIGTGKSPNDQSGFNIKPLAEKYGLWEMIVFEYPARIPYLDVLVHLDSSDGIFILGSTEPHYTPSKVYQGVLSRKPIFAVLHQSSSAMAIMEKANAGVTLPFNGANDMEHLRQSFFVRFTSYLAFLNQFKADSVDKRLLAEFSAKESTRKLANLLSQIV